MVQKWPKNSWGCLPARSRGAQNAPNPRGVPAKVRGEPAKMAPKWPQMARPGGPKGPRRGHFWTIFGPFWALFWTFSDSLEAPRSHLRPSYASLVTQSDQTVEVLTQILVQNGSKMGPKWVHPNGGAQRAEPKKSRKIFLLWS